MEYKIGNIICITYLESLRASLESIWKDLSQDAMKKTYLLKWEDVAIPKFVVSMGTHDINEY